MENQVLIVVLKPGLRAFECQDVISALRLHSKVEAVKTLENVVEAVKGAFPEVRES